ncbi:hypothetical protein [Butyrivibrio proteoclasticus]|uniref:hypothetical protein n=1 Tax=Butyrivibrio proteoclasticus TaxID=43305 RepID=UPI0002E80E2D|nr:hypothetical protein [Butyrivibrio proteoclasticus]
MNVSEYKNFSYSINEGGEGFGSLFYLIKNGSIISSARSGANVNADYLVYSWSATGNSGGHGYLVVR